LGNVAIGVPKPTTVINRKIRVTANYNSVMAVGRKGMPGRLENVKKFNFLQGNLIEQDADSQFSNTEYCLRNPNQIELMGMVEVNFKF
jgi:hypothetical protein